MKAYKDGQEYRFDELDPKHRDEILSHLEGDEAKKSVWVFRKAFSTHEAVWIAEQAADLDLDRVEKVARSLEKGHGMRPILIAEVEDAGEDESAYWVEGQHRAAAAADLGWEGVPVLYRVA